MEVNSKWYRVLVVGMHVKKTPRGNVYKQITEEEILEFGSYKAAWIRGEDIARKLRSEKNCLEPVLINVCQTFQPSKTSFNKLYEEFQKSVILFLVGYFPDLSQSPYWEQVINNISDPEKKLLTAVNVIQSFLDKDCLAFKQFKKKYVDEERTAKEAIEKALTDFFTAQWLGNKQDRAATEA